MKEAILFTKCLGLNDIVSFATQETHPLANDPSAGATELIDCLDVTITRDGALETVPPLVTAITHAANITAISADQRFLYTDGIDTLEWDGTNITTPFPICSGTICHTPIDVRIATASKIYKSTNVAPLFMNEVVLGNNPNPQTSKPFYGMPVYQQAFVYNSRLYAINKNDPRFLEYSEDYHYDLWALGDGFIGFKNAIREAGAVFSEKTGQTGALLCIHDYGVTVLDGSGPADFFTKYYDCNVIGGTLYSGYIPKQYQYGHVFLCNDGVYFVDGDGIMTNQTIKNTSYLNSLNASIVGTGIHNGKYLAFGDQCCVEYDFFTKTFLKRTSAAVGVANWQDELYLAAQDKIVCYDNHQPDEVTGTYPSASFVLPYSKLGEEGAKAISDLYFTGTINGTLTITAICEEGRTWEVTVDGPGKVTNYQIKTPRRVLGNHVSFKFDSTGYFRLERLRALFQPSQRSR